jgi:hypothetical protein
LREAMPDYSAQKSLLLIYLCTWVRVQKPEVTYDIVSYCRKAVGPNFFSALPNVHFNYILPFLLNIAHFIINIEMQKFKSKYY